MNWRHSIRLLRFENQFIFTGLFTEAPAGVFCEKRKQTNASNCFVTVAEQTIHRLFSVKFGAVKKFSKFDLVKTSA